MESNNWEDWAMALSFAVAAAVTFFVIQSATPSFAITAGTIAARAVS